jgi:large subunit ribosomal protein L9
MDIQVILTENDPKLGKRGQVVKVSPGYAQNFLFPHNKAKLATPANLKSFEQEKVKNAKEEAKRLAQAKEQAARLSSAELKLEVSVGEGDRLFGSVTSQDIIEALSKKGITLDRKKLHLEEPIKRLGEHPVPVKLHPEVSVQIKVSVVKRS